MPYVGSYVWRIRKKIGHDLLVIPSADCVAIDKKGRLLLVYNRDFDAWVFPGGYVEDNQTSQLCAARELLEEGGLEVDPELLIPFGFSSGRTLYYSSGDITQPYTQYFIARQWKDKGSLIDEQEVSERRWFSLSDLSKMELHNDVKKVIEAYSVFERTGCYQMIELGGFSDGD